MKNKTLIVTAVSVVVLLIGVRLYKKAMAQKTNISKDIIKNEIDYGSPEYQAYLKRKIDIALGLDESNEMVNGTVWEV